MIADDVKGGVGVASRLHAVGEGHAVDEEFTRDIGAIGAVELRLKGLDRAVGQGDGDERQVTAIDRT